MGDTTVESTPVLDSPNKPASQRIIDKVAEAKDVDPLDLDPLFTAVDPEALDSLFLPQLKDGGVADASAEITFEYHGYQIRVTATGCVRFDTDHV
jgi:hypothetical protein